MVVIIFAVFGEIIQTDIIFAGTWQNVCDSVKYYGDRGVAQLGACDIWEQITAVPQSPRKVEFSLIFSFFLGQSQNLKIIAKKWRKNRVKFAILAKKYFKAIDKTRAKEYNLSG